MMRMHAAAIRRYTSLVKNEDEDLRFERMRGGVAVCDGSVTSLMNISSSMMGVD